VQRDPQRERDLHPADGALRAVLDINLRLAGTRGDLRDWSQWWTFRFGANWRKPYGPGLSIKGLDEHPVVHVAYRDAEAYARWAGKELPDGSRMGVCCAGRARGQGIRLATSSRLVVRIRHLVPVAGAF